MQVGVEANYSGVLAVTGITGHTGRLFLKELENNNFGGTLRCLVRKDSDTSALDSSPIKTEKIVGDNESAESLHALTKGADILLHIYNIHHSVSVLKKATQNNVRRVVMVHTTGVYSKFKEASEEYKTIEAQIDEILKGSDVNITIIRPTMIFGDMCDRNIHKFIKMVDKFPVMPEINRGAGKIRPVNARDLAKAYYTVCMCDSLPEIRYDLSGERSLSLHELFELIGEFLGKKVHYISCPMWLGCFGAKLVKAISFKKLDLVERVLRMGEDRDYGHDAATRDFGYTPEPFCDGLRREVSEYKKLKNSNAD